MTTESPHMYSRELSMFGILPVPLVDGVLEWCHEDRRQSLDTEDMLTAQTHLLAFGATLLQRKLATGWGHAGLPVATWGAVPEGESEAFPDGYYWRRTTYPLKKIGKRNDD